jgi:hypothetical protein
LPNSADTVTLMKAGSHSFLPYETMFFRRSHFRVQPGMSEVVIETPTCQNHHLNDRL